MLPLRVPASAPPASTSPCEPSTFGRREYSPGEYSLCECSPGEYSPTFPQFLDAVGSTPPGSAPSASAPSASAPPASTPLLSLSFWMPWGVLPRGVLPLRVLPRRVLPPANPQLLDVGSTPPASAPLRTVLRHT